MAAGENYYFRKFQVGMRQVCSNIQIQKQKPQRRNNIDIEIKNPNPWI